jgi:ferric-dicitrate binding protein FerR (iron transport regulator)
VNFDAEIRIVCVVIICAAVSPTSAQIQPSVAALTRVEGAVYLDDRLVVAPLSAAALPSSALIRTASGRAVVALKGGGTLALNEQTQVRVLANGVYNFNRIEVVEGTVVVVSGTSAPLVSCRSDARLSSAGIFRFDVQTTGTGGLITCRFRVYDGAAAVQLVTVFSAVRSGQEMTLDPSCGDMIPTVTFRLDQTDDFDRWSRQHAAVSLR